MGLFLSLLIQEQIVGADGKQLCQPYYLLQVRDGLGPLPFGYGLAADPHLFGQLLLGPAALFSQLYEFVCKYHREPPFLFSPGRTQHSSFPRFPPPIGSVQFVNCRLRPPIPGLYIAANGKGRLPNSSRSCTKNCAASLFIVTISPYNRGALPFWPGYSVSFPGLSPPGSAGSASRTVSSSPSTVKRRVQPAKSMA